MAPRGSKKELSQRHERYIACVYGGRVSPSSGGAVTDEGDVYIASENVLVECKAQFGELVGNKPVRATLLKQFAKVAMEATDKQAEPVMALRYYAPDSFIADDEGWVDLTVRLTADDVVRSGQIEWYRESWPEGDA